MMSKDQIRLFEHAAARKTKKELSDGDHFGPKAPVGLNDRAQPRAEEMLVGVRVGGRGV